MSMTVKNFAVWNLGLWRISDREERIAVENGVSVQNSNNLELGISQRLVQGH